MSDLATVEATFAASRSPLDAVAVELRGPDGATLTHCRLEDPLGVRMREVIRQLFDDHLRLRALTERRLPELVQDDRSLRPRLRRPVRDCNESVTRSPIG
ncbi:hypothetical protein [Kitasatospora sp. NPDC005748]|uniref:hypothetical protein n=1 Tax=Kitasatospora sp. NPDC005748 TaxID=3157063 RepID=UPI0033CBB356